MPSVKTQDVLSIGAIGVSAYLLYSTLFKRNLAYDVGKGVAEATGGALSGVASVPFDAGKQAGSSLVESVRTVLGYPSSYAVYPTAQEALAAAEKRSTLDNFIGSATKFGLPTYVYDFGSSIYNQLLTNNNTQEIATANYIPPVLKPFNSSTAAAQLQSYLSSGGKLSLVV